MSPNDRISIDKRWLRLPKCEWYGTHLIAWVTFHICFEINCDYFRAEWYFFRNPSRHTVILSKFTLSLVALSIFCRRIARWPFLVLRWRELLINYKLFMLVQYSNSRKNVKNSDLPPRVFVLCSLHPHTYLSYRVLRINSDFIFSTWTFTFLWKRCPHSLELALVIKHIADFINFSILSVIFLQNFCRRRIIERIFSKIDIPCNFGCPSLYVT